MEHATTSHDAEVQLNKVQSSMLHQPAICTEMVADSLFTHMPYTWTIAQVGTELVQTQGMQQLLYCWIIHILQASLTPH